MRVRGSVAPFVAGAGVELSVFRGPRRVLHETRRVTASQNGRGKFSLWIKPSRRGVYRVTVRQPGAAVADSKRLYVVRPERPRRLARHSACARCSAGSRTSAT